MGMTSENLAAESVAIKKLTIKDYISYIGPGTIMAAAVVGPGTVTTCSKQGATYGYQALWIMAIACIIAYFYQEPAIRVVLGTKKSVMAGIRENIGTKYAKGAYGIICYGSAAHQAANLVGAAMALNFFIPSVGVVVWAAIIAAIAFVIVLVNKYALVEKVNTVLILLMVGAFVVTMFVSGPSITDIFTEGFTFKVPGGDVLLVLALMSTTIMPDLSGQGKGGRNQELVLSAAEGLAGLIDTVIISVGSDGTDGPTEAAGGYCDGDTKKILKKEGISIYQTLKDNDAYHALEKCDGLIFTGATGTNVNDVAVLLIRR